MITNIADIFRILVAGLFVLGSVTVAGGQVINLRHPGAGPYSTIQAAINHPATVTGDTLHISAGIYAESDTVNKSITLWGEGTGTIISPPKGTGIVVKSSNVTLRSLTVANATPYGILTSSGISSLTLMSIICDSDSIGAYLNNVNGLTISESRFSRNRSHGFYSVGGRDFSITNSAAHRNGTGPIGSGMMLTYLSGTSVLNDVSCDSNKTHGLEIGTASKNITLNGGRFNNNGSNVVVDGGGIAIIPHASTITNIVINGPLIANNNITTGIFVIASNGTSDSVKGLAIGQAGGSVSITGNGTTRGTGILFWGNVWNATITATFSQGSVPNSAGIIVVGSSASGTSSPKYISLLNCFFSPGYAALRPAIALGDGTPPYYIGTNGITATNCTFPFGSNIDTLIYDKLDDSRLGLVTHTGDITASPADAPLLVFPADSSLNQPANTVFSWSSVVMAADYRFALARDTAFADIVLDTLLRSTSVAVKLKNLERYFWRVDAGNAYGRTPFSSTWSFSTVIAAPSAPTIVSPPADAINMPLTTIMEWTPALRATHYRLTVDDDSMFATPLYNDTLSSTRKAFSLSPHTRYFWRVQGINLGGASDWSSSRFTTLNRPPLAGRLNAPQDMDTLRLTTQHPPVRFKWFRGSDPDSGETLRYWVWFTGPDIDTTVFAGTDTTVAIDMILRLATSSIYRWTVRVSDGAAVAASPDTFFLRTSDGFTGVPNEESHPTGFALHQNYPNPFNPTTNIQYSIPARPAGGSTVEFVTLRVFDLLGREVAVLVNQEMTAGRHTATWDADKLTSGVYFYRFKAGNFTEIRKLILSK